MCTIEQHDIFRDYQIALSSDSFMQLGKNKNKPMTTEDLSKAMIAFYRNIGIFALRNL
jgi:hypothetical protein